MASNARSLSYAWPSLGVAVGAHKAIRVLTTLHEKYDPQMNGVTIEVPYPPKFEENIKNIHLDWGVSGEIVTSHFSP